MVVVFLILVKRLLLHRWSSLTLLGPSYFLDSLFLFQDVSLVNLLKDTFKGGECSVLSVVY